MRFFWLLVVLFFVGWGLYDNNHGFRREADRFGSTVMRKLHQWEGE